VYVGDVIVAVDDLPTASWTLQMVTFEGLGFRF